MYLGIFVVPLNSIDNLSWLSRFCLIVLLPFTILKILFLSNVIYLKLLYVLTSSLYLSNVNDAFPFLHHVMSLISKFLYTRVDTMLLFFTQQLSP
jgi:hypothetical protein